MTIKLKIPNNQKINININDIINFDKELFKVSQKKRIVIPIAKQLKIKTNKIYDYLKKLIDDKVEEGEILAEKKSLFSHKKIRSEYSGKIVEIHHDTGEIAIETEEKNSTGFKSISGKIINITKDEIKIDLKDCYEVEINSTNILEPAGSRFSLILNNNQITINTVEDKAVFVKSLNPYLEAKLTALGAKIIITTKKPKTSVKYVVISKIKDIEKIKTQTRDFILIIPKENKLYFYNEYKK